MSRSVSSTVPGTQLPDERIRELEEIRDDLELVANSDAEYAKYAQNALAKLEALDSA